MLCNAYEIRIQQLGRVRVGYEAERRRPPLHRPLLKKEWHSRDRSDEALAHLVCTFYFQLLFLTPGRSSKKELEFHPQLQKHRQDLNLKISLQQKPNTD